VGTQGKKDSNEKRERLKETGGDRPCEPDGRWITKDVLMQIYLKKISSKADSGTQTRIAAYIDTLDIDDRQNDMIRKKLGIGGSWNGRQREKET
jgi:hypothetical protein